MGDQLVSSTLPEHKPAQTQNKRTQTSMPQVRFEPMIPVFERIKAVHALDRAATVIGSRLSFLATYPDQHLCGCLCFKWWGADETHDVTRKFTSRWTQCLSQTTTPFLIRMGSDVEALHILRFGTKDRWTVQQHDCATLFHERNLIPSENRSPVVRIQNSPFNDWVIPENLRLRDGPTDVAFSW
jgi:hypothetical protein